MKFFFLSSLSLEFIKEDNLDNKDLMKKIKRYTDLDTDGIYINNDFINFFLTQTTVEVNFLELLSMLNNKKRIILEIDQMGLSLITEIFLSAVKFDNMYLVLNPAFFSNQSFKNLSFYFNYVKEHTSLPLLIKLYPLLNKLNYSNSNLDELINSENIKGLIFNTEMAEDFDLTEVKFIRNKFNKLLLSDAESMTYPLFKNGIDGIIINALSQNHDYIYKIKNCIEKSKFKLAKELQINYNEKIFSEMKVRK